MFFNGKEISDSIRLQMTNGRIKCIGTQLFTNTLSCAYNHLILTCSQTAKYILYCRKKFQFYFSLVNTVPTYALVRHGMQFVAGGPGRTGTKCEEIRVRSYTPGSATD